MKLTILTLVITYLTAFQAMSQDLIIKYDFNTKQYSYESHKDTMKSKPTHIMAGSQIQMQVVNVNRLIMDIGFDKVTKTFHSTPPSIPTIGSIPLFKIETGEILKGNFPSPIKNKTEYEDFLGKYESVKQDLRLLNESMIKLEDWNLNQKAIESIKKTLRDIEFESFYDNLDNLDQAYFEYLETGSDTTPNIVTSEIVRIKKELDAKNLRSKYGQIFLLTSNLSDNTFQYKSPIIIATGDEIAIDITIDPKEAKKNLPISSEKIPVKLNVLRKHKYSFSTGIFFSNVVHKRFNNRLNLTSSGITNIDTVASYTLIEEKAQKNTFGIAGFFHYVYQPKYKFGIGLNIGGGIDLQEKIQYLSGVTLSFGHKNRILINSGVAFSEIDILSEGFITESTTSTPLEFKTTRKLKTGFYFSLSYNLVK